MLILHLMPTFQDNFVDTIGPQTYYIDSAAGDDSYSGLTTTYPRKTLAAVNTINPGDTILLKYGSVFNEPLLPQKAGTAAARITYGAYGTPADGKPVINALTLYNNADNWALHSGNIWKVATTALCARLLINRTAEGKAADAASVGEAKKWYQDDEHLYVYATGNPATTYTTPGVEAAQTNYGAVVKSYTTLQNLNILGGWAYGINMEGVTGAIIEDCQIEYPGSAAILGGLYETADNNIIRRNMIHNRRGAGENVASKTAGGDGIIFHVGSGNLIQGNTIVDFPHGGIGLYGYSALPGTNNNIVEGNECYNAVANFGYGISVVGYYRQCYGNIIRYNYLHNLPEGGGQMSADDNQIYYNIFARNTPQGLNLYSAVGGYQARDIEVYNNIFYSNVGDGLRLNAWSEDILNITIRNNIMDENSSYQLYINNDAADVTGLVIDHNILHKTGGEDVVSGRTGYGPYTVAEADAAITGMSDNLADAPVYSNAGGSMLLDTDFAPGIGSPVIDAGAALGLTVDYAGAEVDSPPNIGAME